VWVVPDPQSSANHYVEGPYLCLHLVVGGAGGRGSNQVIVGIDLVPGQAPMKGASGLGHDGAPLPEAEAALAIREARALGNQLLALLLCKARLCFTNEKLFSFKHFENKTHVRLMLSFGLREKYDVVYIDNNKLHDVRMKNRIHHHLKSRWGVR
jgi:hypothetical protein